MMHATKYPHKLIAEPISLEEVLQQMPPLRISPFENEPSPDRHLQGIDIEAIRQLCAAFREGLSEDDWREIEQAMEGNVP